MSAGHHAGEATELDTTIATPDFITQCAALIAACVVVDSFDIPYLANRSTDGRRVYIDQRVPAVLPKTGIDTRLSLPWHELPEWLAMNFGLLYLPAHLTVATPLERREVERQKPNDPDIWVAYSEEMDGYIREVADETIASVPNDLDLRPYEDEHDRKILQELMAAERSMPQSQKSPKRFFRATASPDLANSSGRIIRYRFSTPAVGRDQHTISAWKLDNFRLNPVFLWAHMGKEPPIGKVIELEDNKGYLDGSVEYAERDAYPFADTVFQLVRGGYINAVSTSWDPIDWKFSTDRARPGGIDFKLVDLLELSQVPVPALPTALATARSNGIDTMPLREWAEKVLDEGGMILVPRTELEALRLAAGATPPVLNVPQFLPAREQPKPAQNQSKPQSREALMTPEQKAARDAKLAAFKRGLGHVAYLAYLLSDISYFLKDVEWEASIEQDDSPVPAQLAGVKKQLGEILVAMAGEEVAELIGEESDIDAGIVMPAVDDATPRAVLGMLRGLKKTDWPMVVQMVRAMRTGERVTLATDEAADLVRQALARVGKVLSKKNADALREAHGHITRGCDMVRAVVDEADADNSDDDGDDDKEKERAVRRRKAGAMKHKLALAS